MTTDSVPAAEGTPAPDWRVSLPPELQSEKSLETVKDIPSLARGYVEAQRYVGGSIRIPKDDATPEEWKAFHQKLGVPDAPDKYGVQAPDLPDGLWDKEAEAGFLKVAHEIGLTPKQLSKLYEFEAIRASGRVAGVAMSLDKTSTDLKKEWGGAYDRNLGLAKRAIEQVGGKEFREYLEQSGLGNHPAMARTFAKVGAILAEDGHIDGESVTVGKQAAVEKIAAIRSDSKHAYNDVNHVNHKEAVEAMSRLYQLAYNDV